MNAAVERAIAAIGADVWTPIRYPQAVWDAEGSCWVSDAEVGELAVEHAQEFGEHLGRVRFAGHRALGAGERVVLQPLGEDRRVDPAAGRTAGGRRRPSAARRCGRRPAGSDSRR